MGPWPRRLGLAIVAGAVLGGLGVAGLFAAFDRPGPLTGHVVMVIPKGAGVVRIGELLERHGVIAYANVFKLGVRLTGNHGRLRAGEYDFPGGISARGAMEVLVAGKTVVHRLTIPEGITTARAVALINAGFGLVGALAPIAQEGILLPDTYHYKYGDTRAQLVSRMKKALSREIQRLWKARAEGLPLGSPREAVILASIVERETARAAERPMIAGVFLNRLRRGMALQSDPTVAYGVALREQAPDGVLRRALTRADLAAPGDFNTYLNKGLPPRPIANPGRAALAAVLNPALTKALYFVADGKGGHAFADTLKEHNRNVRRWRKGRKSRMSRPAAPPGPSPGAAPASGPSLGPSPAPPPALPGTP